MSSIFNFHTHDFDATEALISVDPRQFDPQPGKLYSVGFHPWQDLCSLTGEDFALLEQCAAHRQVLAIGETGMDSLRGADLENQAVTFVRHLQVADAVGKPVVVHSVRTAQQILTERRKAHLTGVTLAIHGMRGNEHVARALLDEGCYLSFGMHFNPAALAVTPLDRLLIETDEAPVPITEVACQVAAALSMPVEQIQETAAENARRLLML